MSNRSSLTVPRATACVAATVVVSLWAVPVASQQVYALSADGTMRLLVNPSCQPAECRWIDIDRNPRSISLTATNHGVFQLHDNGEIWIWTGRPWSGGGCPHWQRIDRNPATRSLAAGSSSLFQLHSTGSVWRWQGRACDGTSCASWEALDRNPRTIAISAGGSQLFQLHNDGSVWRWKGEPCRGTACTSWERLDRNSRTRQIAAAAPGELYQRHDDGRIWRWKGRPCLGDDCSGWDLLDNNRNTKTIVAAPGALYQLHTTGAVWRWKGGICSASSCSSWERLDNTPQTRAIAAAEQPWASDLSRTPDSAAVPPIFQVHQSGALWRWTGRPCAVDGCPSWVNVSGGGAFTSFGSSRGGLFVFGGRPFSGSIDAGLPPTAFGYDGMRFARTGVRRAELNVLLIMSTYANTRFDEGQTQAYYENRYFGSDRRIESYFNANSRDVVFKINHVGTLRVTDPRTLACAHRWATCPGDGLPFTTATVEQLERLTSEQVRPYLQFDRNRDGVLASDELFVLKVEGLPDRGTANPFDDNGGLKRPLPRCATLQGTSIRLCGEFLPVGDETNLITVLHEFAHLFGALDIYGSAGNNYRYSLMGPTWEPGEFFVQLDPWHKMRMGLVTPKIIPIPASTSDRQEIRLTLPVNTSAYQPVLFYDPARATEFVMLEFRRQRAGGFDSDVAGTGLVIWHVKTDASFVPVNYQTLGSGFSEGAAVAVLGAPGQTVGRGPAWTSVHGVIALNWPGRGDSGLRIQVQPVDSGASFVTFHWWRN